MANDVQVDFLIDVGEDWAFQMYWTDQYDDPIQVINPMKMTVKDSLGATVDTYISGSDTPVGGQLQYLTFNTETGFIQLSLPDSYTNTLTPGIYSYDLWAHVDDPDDINNTTKRSKIFGGNFIVLAAVTTF